MGYFVDFGFWICFKAFCRFVGVFYLRIDSFPTFLFTIFCSGKGDPYPIFVPILMFFTDTFAFVYCREVSFKDLRIFLWYLFRVEGSTVFLILWCSLWEGGVKPDLHYLYNPLDFVLTCFQQF